jgi:hypothetical protein
MCFFGSFADANSALSTKEVVIPRGWQLQLALKPEEILPIEEGSTSFADSSERRWLAFVAIRIIQ